MGTNGQLFLDFISAFPCSLGGRKEGSALWSVNVCRVSKYGTKALRGMTSVQSGDCASFRNVTKMSKQK